jgi:hypothetical protein
MPKFDVVQNFTMKPDVKKSCKQTKQKSTTLGFQNKRASHLISRKLRNRTDAHLSSIEVNEVLDSEIEDFLALEDPDCQKFGPTESYDFVMNLSSCLKGKEGLYSIGLGQGKIIGKVDTTMFDCTLHQHIVPPIQCDVCFHWIEQYYTDIPILQAQIKTLTAQSESPRQENLDLRVNIERKSKCLKRIGNIVIKNATSVKEIINSKLP